MQLARLVLPALVTSALGVGAREAAAQPAARADLPAPPLVVPRSCVSNIERAAQWFVRELDSGTVTSASGPGWRAWRGTTVDADQVVAVLWVRIEVIDPASPSAGAVSGWLEIDGAAPGMAVAPPAGADALPIALPDTHHARSLGRWRLVRSLVDGTPKEEAYVHKAIDKCAAALLKPPPRRR